MNFHIKFFLIIFKEHFYKTLLLSLRNIDTSENIWSIFIFQQNSKNVPQSPQNFDFIANFTWL